MRALVIEDFDALRLAVVDALDQLGWAVDATGDGKEGLWYAKGTDYDVIVLDLMLPGMPGLDVLRQLRSGGGNSPVLILSAKDGVQDRVDGLDAGADDYLIKPFAVEELQARVRSLVRRRSPNRSPEVCIGTMAIDRSRRRVTSANRPIELTPREYAILEFLVLRQGEVVSRTSIWDHVYSFNDDGQSNVVDVYISSLRRKLECHGEPRIIHTRRGHGYILEPEGSQ